ncbi:hypothetical protein [Streptomyces kebangsaanensis]|uniref:hypothetical protein n=1 Tax=Streptomyces kebangsaanensis TaxID=864058 RepID=UPI00093BA7EA|nr:hypothetical protein [Streptomyces kebangsaanensis]
MWVWGAFWQFTAKHGPGRPGGTGTGEAWRASGTAPHRNVAFRTVRPDAEASDVSRERVLREAVMEPASGPSSGPFPQERLAAGCGPYGP